MTTTDVSKIGRAWTDLLKEELSDPAECLDYLQHIAEHEPAMASVALTDVLEACPQIAAVAIPRYAHLLTAQDLQALADRFSEAARYISTHHSALAHLLTA